MLLTWHWMHRRSELSKTSQDESLNASLMVAKDQISFQRNLANMLEDDSIATFLIPLSSLFAPETSLSSPNAPTSPAAASPVDRLRSFLIPPLFSLLPSFIFPREGKRAALSLGHRLKPRLS